MDIITLKAFFLWCTIINGAILLFTFLMCIFAADLFSPIHCKLYKVSRETVNTVVYSFILFYKIFWLVFNLVPWLALLIIA